MHDNDLTAGHGAGCAGDYRLGVPIYIHAYIQWPERLVSCAAPAFACVAIIIAQSQRILHVFICNNAT